MSTIRVGARRSPLAVAQATWVASRLEAAGYPSELVGIDTLGDVDRRRLTEIGGTGVFATAVRDGLLSGGVDVAVHSLKDLPVDPAPGLVVAATPTREDVRDVLVGLGVDEWRDGTRLGTGSPRRAVQLAELARARGVEVEIVPIRGNVDHRIDLVRQGEVHATLLAAAGLRRLGRIPADLEGIGEVGVASGSVRIELLELSMMLPAAGQGCLGVECREDADPALLTALASIDDVDTHRAVSAERTFLKVLEAGCLAPVGAFAYISGSHLTLRAVAGRESGDAGLVRDELSGDAQDAVELGSALARRVLALLGKDLDE
ncbi:hydroxymethylbilane synthase [Luteococcus sanguinis]|uniref:Hydroxymethylbilane synthase n=1 Tax=Luteococcus sanguinis TaxID=174038 RepID=A0ABW1X2P8_9ACTN